MSDIRYWAIEILEGGVWKEVVRYNDEDRARGEYNNTLALHRNEGSKAHAIRLIALAAQTMI